MRFVSAPHREWAVSASSLALIAVLSCKAPASESQGASAKDDRIVSPRQARSARAPERGDVAPLVRSALEQSAAKGERLVVYVGAIWCDPCRRFHAAVERGELDSTFPGLVLLEFDSDHDGERLAAAGYSYHYIPLLALPKEDGTASGKQVEGGIKGEGAVAVIRERLKGLLAQK